MRTILDFLATAKQTQCETPGEHHQQMTYEWGSPWHSTFPDGLIKGQLLSLVLRTPKDSRPHFPTSAHRELSDVVTAELHWWSLDNLCSIRVVNTVPDLLNCTNRRIRGSQAQKTTAERDETSAARYETGMKQNWSKTVRATREKVETHKKKEGKHFLYKRKKHRSDHDGQNERKHKTCQTHQRVHVFNAHHTDVAVFRESSRIFTHPDVSIHVITFINWRCQADTYDIVCVPGHVRHLGRWLWSRTIRSFPVCSWTL